MTRRERLDILASILRQFTVLMEEIPPERRKEVSGPFAIATGAYLKVMEEVLEE